MARKIKLKYMERCRNCGQMIPTGTEAYWETKRGVWHIECATGRDRRHTVNTAQPSYMSSNSSAFVLDTPFAFERKSPARSKAQSSRSFSGPFKISHSTQIALVFVIVILLAFGGTFFATSLSPSRPTSPSGIESSYTPEISYMTTITTSETTYVTDTLLSILTFTTTAGTKTTPPSKGMFVGSRLSNIYHWPSCYLAHQISPKNEIWFRDSADARAHGYRPCKVCNPP